MSRRSSQALRFIVVGGSIAGVACAYALQDAGHQVMVVEQGDGRSNVCKSILSSLARCEL